ncbi:MAG: hypothetical protein KDI98_07875 [Hyphomicrobiaceae bacterium]|nr:hypothetical protein [Hyphomicrobiaceae bacterium]
MSGEGGPDANERDRRAAARREEAEAALKRAERDAETFGTSQLARQASRARDHFGGADGEDSIEIWGRRIGRGLALVVVMVLIYHLLNTYVFN